MMSRVVFCIVALLMYSSLLWSDAPSTVEGKPRLPALSPWKGEGVIETGYKNIKRLKHLSGVELGRVMGYIVESLGIKCTFCHNEINYSLDVKPAKKRARVMISMVQYVNQEYFKTERITCYTCHLGSTTTKYLPERFRRLPSLIGNGKSRKLPADYFKNVKKLIHLTEDEYYLVMDFFVTSLGEKDCFACHKRRDFSSDGPRKKVRARGMIGMVQEITPKFFNDERLTCYTCHRGNTLPKQVSEGWIPGWK